MKAPVAFAAAVLASLCTAAPSAGEVPAGLTPAQPVVCSGNQDIELVGRYIETEGNGVEVRGNCTVEIIGSRIVAGGVAVLVTFNGDAEIENSVIEGGKGALVAEGNAGISYAGSTIRGGIALRGNAEIDDEGGNTVEGGTAAVPPVPATETVVVGVPGASVVVGPDGVRIRSGGSEVVVSDEWRTPAGAAAYDEEQVLIDLGAVVEGNSLKLQLAGDVLFDFDSTAVRSDAAAQLAKVAHVLRSRSRGEIVLTGHTDAEGSDEYNQKLSEDRAVAVMRWLHDQESIPAGLMVARGMGEKKPVAYNTMPDGSDNPDGRAKNRRVEISFVTAQAAAAGATGVVIDGGGVRVQSEGSDVQVGPGGISVQGDGSKVKMDSAGTSAVVEELVPLGKSCADICAVWPTLSEEQMECVSGALTLRGYDIIGNLACTAVETASHCRICWQTVKVSEKDCDALKMFCLGM